MSFRVGMGVEDRCAACKTGRRHTVTAVAGDVVRVICDFCGSQHNYRGGPRVERPRAGDAAIPVRERREAPVSPENAGPEDANLERLLRRVVREELGLSPAPIAARWSGGELVLRP